MNRIQTCFQTLKTQKRSAFIPFIMGGDPSLSDTAVLLPKLVEAGADIIEIGVPFSDPMADGPVIEAAGLRSLKQGTTLTKILQLVKEFRASNQTTPLILMGYYNPFYRYGIERFAKDAAAAGVDGVILVDIPMEEAAEVMPALNANHVDFIRLVAPTTLGERQKALLQQASGFVYFISVKGITGAQTATQEALKQSIAQLRQHTDLPIAIGFGIQTPEQAAQAAQIGDAVVVGSALVKCLSDQNQASMLDLAKRLANAAHLKQVK
jgi:tryptophan synthase alpha chain